MADNQDTHNKDVNDANNTSDASGQQQDQDDFKLLAQRVQADFDNFRKRTQTQQRQFEVDVKAGVVRDILPVLDAFAMSVAHKDEEDPAKLKNIVVGVGYIYEQLLGVLTHQGVEQIQTNGTFDPHLHEAVSEEQSDKEPGTILSVQQIGYKIGERVVRHAKVVVAASQTSSDETDTSVASDTSTEQR